MDPNAREPGNQGGSAVEPPVNNISPDLSGLQNVVNAAREAAAAQTTPRTQFEDQFGSPQAATPPVADSATGQGLIDTALANLGTPQQTQPPAAETLAPEPEQTSAEKLKKQIADNVNAFLEEVTKEKVVA